MPLLRLSPLPGWPPARAARRAVALFALLSLAAPAACSRGEAARGGRGADGADAAGDVGEEDTPPVVPYRVTEVADGGSIRGTVELDGAPPGDTTVTPTFDTDVCGSSFTDPTVQLSGKHVGGVVVWLSDARSGRAPGDTRRFEITNQDCRFRPRVQAVLAGGTLNVHNLDGTLHRDRFLRGGHTVALVRFNDEGEVVPERKVLARPGRTEVRCDLHPWERGWILVFDHPYYDTTGSDGSFEITGVPPGHYHLVAWHERLGTVQQEVTVDAGKAAQVTLTMRALQQ